jgi:tRNA (guanine-N7-)-methyltransferase
VSKKKLVHFQENLTFPHLFQYRYHEIESHFHMRSKWNAEFFHNLNPLVLELGCGKGEYTVGLAAKYTDKNYIGIDLKGARLWRGCKTVQEQQLKNVAFIRTRVDHIEKFFGEGEVSEIWITFPDPQAGKARKRLTAKVFIDRYRNILAKDGIIHLKTDDQGLYTYTLEVIAENNLDILFATDDLYNSHSPEDLRAIQTYYEKIWLEKGKKISYVQFQLK